MSRSSSLRFSDLRAVFNLVGECRELGDDPNVWCRHWFASLARMVGAALALGGEAEWSGGRLEIVAPFDWGWENGLDRSAYLRFLTEIKDDLSRFKFTQAYFAHPARR